MIITNKTFRELTEGKEIEYTDVTFQAGYMSRKTTMNDLADQIVKIAERGEHKGMYFINTPCFTSSRYMMRQYFAVREDRR